MIRTLTSLPLKNGKTLWYRENSSDMAMWKENPYRGSDFNSYDIVMDVGANIGDFPLRFSQQVASIHSYEPMPDTFGVLKKNVEENEFKNCHIYNTAIAPATGETTIFFNEKAKLAHAVASVLPIRGRTELKVKTLSFEEEVRRIQPTIIKMDIEGAEFDILNAVSDDVFRTCRVFFLETHMQMLRGDSMEWNRKIGERFHNLFGSSEEKKTFYFKVHNCSVWKFERI
jgi:FkbM family methyltransferase